MLSWARVDTGGAIIQGGRTDQFVEMVRSTSAMPANLVDPEELVRSLDLGDVFPYAVLAGAGLSRNWGGYLASEMWGTILSQPTIEGSERLRSLFLHETDFERALGSARSDPAYDAGDRLSVEAAVRAAFERHDEILRHSLRGDRGEGSWMRFQDRILRPLIEFPPERSRTSFVFTLNQDLLLERGFRRPTDVGPKMPGVKIESKLAWFPGEEPGKWKLDPFSRAEHTGLVGPLAPVDFALRGRCTYVKLHGSFNWRTEDEDVMVLGTAKSVAIQRFPLLDAYLRLFRRVCTLGGVRLLVIGYRFADEHINGIIADAVENTGLKLVIVDPCPSNELRSALGPDRIWRGVVGHFSRPLSDTFGGVAGPTGEASRLRDVFLRGAV
jgi:hypothetical protein